MITPTQRNWVYARGVWSEAPKPFWPADHSGEWADILEMNGFEKSGGSLFGAEYDLMHGILHNCADAEKTPHAFLVDLTVADGCYTVLIPDLPSLWRFCREAKDLAGLTNHRMRVEDAEEKAQEEYERKYGPPKRRAGLSGK